MLAERRITYAEVAQLRVLIAAACTDKEPDLARRFRIDFWRVVARASRNELFQQQGRWWSSLVAELDKRGGAARVPGQKLDLDQFDRLTDALAAHRGAPQIHLEHIRPLQPLANLINNKTRVIAVDAYQHPDHRRNVDAPYRRQYDLYSVGPDGESVPPLTAKHSRDDIVMANDGGFIGVASDY